MPKITYYAIINERRPVTRPKGLIRRIHTEPVPTDEEFTRDLEWVPSEFLQLYRLGHNDDDYVEITPEQAEQIIADRRERLQGRQPSGG
ncbi:MAG: hypothetical protein ACM3ML_33080 [Micromonosporaceae bacterium]